MSANPLVADAVDTSTTFGGAGLADSLDSLTTSLREEDWLATGLSGIAVAMDTAATVSDPLGSLIAAGLGWVIEHLDPLKGWLNDLTGDAGQVLGFASTWSNIATQLAGAADELDRVVTTDLDAMSGTAINRYSATAHLLADRIRGASDSANAMSGALTTCSTIVQVVHDLVRDTLAELAGAIISWAAELVLTAGLATPVIIEQITTRVGELASKVGKNVTDVIDSATSLRTLLKDLKNILDEFADAVHIRPHSEADIPTNSTATRHPSGMTISDGARRTLDDQIADPQIHPSLYGHVEQDYDPFAGMSSTEFMEQYHSKVDPKTGKEIWNWPDGGGEVPGSARDLKVSHLSNTEIARIGGSDGTYFSEPQAMFGELALPPDRLNFERKTWTIETSHPALTTGTVRVHESTVAPGFGQRGGAIQYQFITIDKTGAEVFLSQAEAVELGLITGREP